MLENNNINIWIIFSHKLCKNMKKRHYFEKKSPKKGTLRKISICSNGAFFWRLFLETFFGDFFWRLFFGIYPIFMVSNIKHSDIFITTNALKILKSQNIQK